MATAPVSQMSDPLNRVFDMDGNPVAAALLPDGFNGKVIGRFFVPMNRNLELQPCNPSFGSPQLK